MDLGKGLRQLISKITKKPYIDESEVKLFIKDLQRILISSDVEVKLVFQLSKNIEKRALTEEKKQGLTLREHLLKVVYDELVALMGESYSPRIDKHKVLLLGLFGSGKSTTASKLAYFYKKKGLSVLLVGADVERPAAQEQLEQLASQIEVEYFTIKGEKDASKIVDEALKNSKENVIIVDSAGRSAFDGELKDELKGISDSLKPDESFLVVSGDIGQVAGKQAKEFSEALPITGVVVTKMDGRGKGGGALSAVAATGSKIAFIGTGEKKDDFEIYNSSKFVERLLGIPDIEGLMEKMKHIAESEKLEQKQFEKFTIKAFYQQMKAAKKMGPLDGVFSMMGLSDVPEEVLHQGETKLKRFEAIINSMTEDERENAELVKKSKSRIDRISKGAGVASEEVREFLSQFFKMEGMFKRFKKDRGFRKKLEKMMGQTGMNLGGFGG
ncbi:signal recognition particle protein [Candidatus Micrarchaeota archaeon]|nr:signal recognition particle protein [Candidatus Micrarchaeota archaeon]